MSDDPYLRSWPLLTQPRNAPLKHRDIAQIQQIVSRLVNQNAH
jgi:hypothetical protein